MKNQINKADLMSSIDDSISLNPDATILQATREYCQMNGIKYTEEIGTNALEWQYQELDNITYGTPYFN